MTKAPHIWLAVKTTSASWVTLFYIKVNSVSFIQVQFIALLFNLNEKNEFQETLHCVKLVAFYLRNPSLPTLCILKHQTSKYSCWILVPRKKIWFVAKLVNAKTQLKKKNYYGKNIWSTYLINYVHVEFMRMGSLSFCHIRLIFFNYNFLHYRYC